MVDLNNSVQLAGNKTVLAGETGTTFMLNKRGATAATSVLTYTGASVDNLIVTIGTKVYTTQNAAGFTQANGVILLGASATIAALNQTKAINLGPGEGVDYGAAMTLNTDVTAVVAAGLMTVTARVPGTAGNSIVTTENQTNASWTAGTLAGGAVTAAATQNEFTITLPDDAVDGTNYRFMTMDDGRTVIDDTEYFTNYTLTCLSATKSFIVTGNIGGTFNGTRQVLNDQFAPATTTRAILISNSPKDVGQKVNIPYLPGEILELNFFQNVWYGNVVWGSRIRGAQPQ